MMTGFIRKLFSRCCLGCGVATDGENVIMCEKCEKEMKDTPPLETMRITSAVSYSTDQAKKLIHHMKRFNDAEVFAYSAELIYEKLCDKGLDETLSDYYITYAPRNPVTFLLRRFDQSKEIADYLSYLLYGEEEKRVISLFKRKIFTAEQKKLGSVGRVLNAKNIFSIKRNVNIPEKLIIVDDITTTGSTLLTLRDIAQGAGVGECMLCTVALNDSRN